MRLDKETLVETATALAGAAGFALLPCSREFDEWAKAASLPEDLLEFFRSYTPQGELWAGAGVIYAGVDIKRWNESFPDALRSDLLIIGSAANGDHIAIDVVTGAVGYLSHEHQWCRQPRDYFIAVSASFGAYLRDINSPDSPIPDDYFEARLKMA